jgi:hypothetical protein
MTERDASLWICLASLVGQLAIHVWFRKRRERRAAFDAWREKQLEALGYRLRSMPIATKEPR